MLLEASLLLFVTYIVAYVVQTWLEIRKLPPGPIPLPIIGNLHQIGTNPPFTMLALCDKYPNVLRVKSPVGNCVFLNSTEAAREALLTRKTDFAGRPLKQLYPVTEILGTRDIITSDYGPAFTFRTKLFKTALHLFGEGTREVEQRLHRTLWTLFGKIDERLEKTTSLKTLVASAIIIQLWEWLSSERLDYGDEKLHKIIDFNNRFTDVARQGSLAQLFPLLSYLPTEFKRQLEASCKARDEIFGEVLDNHKRTYQDGKVRDITDAMLSAYDTKDEKKSKMVGSNEDILYLMMDVIIAGADTSNSLMDWCILHLVLMEDVQGKLQEELDKFMEKDSLPNLEQAKKLHYLHAVVCEVLRMTGFVPLLVPHRATRDTSVMGHHIPKNMMVFVNQYRVHHDPSAWEGPDLFNPQRFLDENGNFVGWNAQLGFLPFGLGRRACPGQDLGKLQVLIMLASIFYRYSIKIADNKPRPKLDDPEVRAITCPKEYDVVITKRH